MKVTAARFLGAAAGRAEGPAPAGPEVAIAGRSNVGKSSLLNVLLARKGLARTSATPGRTRQINFFLVNERLVIADLPGYGFAVGSEAERAAWGPLVEGYLRRRAPLRGVAVLVDVRRGLQDAERQLLDFLDHVELPSALVVTKIDKLGRNAASVAVATLGREVGPDVPVVGWSSHTGAGRDALWGVLRGWLDAPPRVLHNGDDAAGPPARRRR
ncbi:MAG: ribosome biogenesis GTP-binding protein YihA/YsxC [bacterium]|nr:ribosome biogenesis GTP-binding protein YihA/YsxC [bacterium]